MIADGRNEREETEYSAQPDHAPLSSERDLLQEIGLCQSMLSLKAELDRFHLSLGSDQAERILRREGVRGTSQQDERAHHPVNTRSGSAE
jgi:hypothetical protein